MRPGQSRAAVPVPLLIPGADGRGFRRSGSTGGGVTGKVRASDVAPSLLPGDFVHAQSDPASGLVNTISGRQMGTEPSGGHPTESTRTRIRTM